VDRLAPFAAAIAALEAEPTEHASTYLIGGGALLCCVLVLPGAMAGGGINPNVKLRALLSMPVEN